MKDSKVRLGLRVRRFMALAGIVVVLGGVVVTVLWPRWIRSGRVLAEQKLHKATQSIFGEHVTFDPLHFSPRSRSNQEIRVRHLIVRPEEGSPPIISADEVVITIDLMALVKWETPEVTDVLFQSPTITLSRTPDDGVAGSAWNLVRLIKMVKEYRDRLPIGERGARTPPSVRIVGGVLELHDSVLLREPIRFEDLNLAIGPVGDGAERDRMEISGRCTSGEARWNFGGMLTMVDGNLLLESFFVNGKHIPIGEDLRSILQGNGTNIWDMIAPSGTLKEFTANVTRQEGGGFDVKMKFDSSELEFGLLNRTIGERLLNLEAEVSMSETEGVSLSARARGAGDARDTIFRFDAALQGASGSNAYDKLHFHISDVDIDDSTRQTMAELIRIGNQLRTYVRPANDAGLDPDPGADIATDGEVGAEASTDLEPEIQRDIDEIMGENLARKIFDHYQPRGRIALDADYFIPRQSQLRSLFKGELVITGGSLNVPLGVRDNGKPIAVPVVDLAGVISFENDDLEVKKGTRLVGRLADAVVEFDGMVRNATEESAKRWFADVHIRDLELGDTLLAKLAEAAEVDRTPAWFDVLTQYKVRGMADAAIKMSGSGRDVPFRVVEIHPLGNMSFVHPDFPYLVEGVRGTFKVADNRIDFALTGEHQSAADEPPAVIEINGALEDVNTPDELSVIFIRGTGMKVDESFLTALERVQAQAAELLRVDLDAKGRVDVAVKFRRDFNQELGKSVASTNVNVELHDCTARWRGTSDYLPVFRYRLSRINGTVKIRDDLVILEDLKGFSDKGEEFKIYGRINEQTPVGRQSRVGIASDRLSFSDDLQTLLGTVDNRYLELWRDFDPKGHVKVDYLLTTGPGDKSRTHIEIEPQGATALAADFPLPVRNINQGRIVIEDGMIWIEKLTSQDGESTLVIDGTVDSRNSDRVMVDLKVKARHLELNDELFRAVPDTVKGFWLDFSPHGFTDVDVEIASVEDLKVEDDLDIRVEVAFKGVDARYQHLKVPLSEIKGKLVYDNKFRTDGGEREHRLTFVQLGATALGGELEVKSGTVRGTGETSWANLQIVGSGLDLASPDLPAIGDRLKGLRELLQPTGKIEFDCVLVVEDDKPSGQGRISSTDFKLRDVVVESLSADVMLKDGMLLVPEIRGHIYGGILEGSLTLDTSSFGAYDARLAISGVDAKPFTADVFGVRSDRLRGVLAADLQVSGQGSARENIIGRGSVSVKDGWLWEVPIFLGILDSVSPSANRLEEAKGFKECEANFRIADGMLRFDRIHVDANTLRIQGRGDMDFDGALNMVVTAASTPETKIPLISDVLSGVAGGLIGFEVGGTYRNPELEVQPIKMVTDIFAEFADSLGADIAPTQPVRPLQRP